MDTTDLVAKRDYSKGDVRLMVIVRVVSGSDVNGLMLRYEEWVNNVEDVSKRDDSGDLHYLSQKFYAKLVDLYHEGWKFTGAMDGTGKQHARFFDPAML
jgi:hypothetical protein